MSDFSDFAYVPQYSGYYPRSGPSMIAADGTLSLGDLAAAITKALQKKTQEINSINEQQTQQNGDGGGAGQTGGGGGAQGGGVGSATMLQMQKAVSEYTTMLQQGTSMMTGVGDTHKAVAQNTK